VASGPDDTSPWASPPYTYSLLRAQKLPANLSDSPGFDAWLAEMEQQLPPRSPLDHGK
jgi:hypothetical protein